MSSKGRDQPEPEQIADSSKMADWFTTHRKQHLGVFILTECKCICGKRHETFNYIINYNHHLIDAVENYV